MIAQEYPFTDEQSKQIESSLRMYHSKIAHRTNKVWFEFVDLEYVLSIILSGEHKAALVDGFLVLYGTGQLWYNPRITAIEECLVIRVGRGGSLRSVTAFLESKGRLLGASLVLVGTALAHSDTALASMYESNGYQVAAYQLTKQI